VRPGDCESSDSVNPHTPEVARLRSRGSTRLTPTGSQQKCCARNLRSANACIAPCDGRPGIGTQPRHGGAPWVGHRPCEVHKRASRIPGDRHPSRLPMAAPSPQVGERGICRPWRGLFGHPPKILDESAYASAALCFLLGDSPSLGVSTGADSGLGRPGSGAPSAAASGGASRVGRRSASESARGLVPK